MKFFFFFFFYFVPTEREISFLRSVENFIQIKNKRFTQTHNAHVPYENRNFKRKKWNMKTLKIQWARLLDGGIRKVFQKKIHTSVNKFRELSMMSQFDSSQNWLITLTHRSWERSSQVFNSQTYIFFFFLLSCFFKYSIRSEWYTSSADQFPFNNLQKKRKEKKSIQESNS